jgi:hypothetical protein
MFSTFFTETLNTKIGTITGTIFKKKNQFNSGSQPILEPVLGSGSNYSNAKNRKAIPLWF